MEITQSNLQGIAYFIVYENLLEKEKIIFYQHQAALSKQSLLTYLVNEHILSATILATLLARRFALPLINIECLEVTRFPWNALSSSLCLQHQVIPLALRNRHLFLATADPTNPHLWQEIEFLTGLIIQPVVVEIDKLLKIIIQWQNKKALACTQTEDLETQVTDLFTLLFVDAVKKKISDIHIEPYISQYRIRYRMDGLLFETKKIPSLLANRLLAKIKLLAALDIAEKRQPQDGRFSTLIENNAIDCRISTCPTLDGEKLVVRFFNPHEGSLTTQQLGFHRTQERIFLQALEKPQGMILITGPTGSGKTSTLYTALNVLNRLEKNIISIEDPVEIRIPGINQININLKIGLTFSYLLKTILRQDPDVIMLGEIRDQETAKISIQAAQTGHLVLSTVHAKNTIATLSRLTHLGIAPYQLANVVNLIIAQRLIRTICQYCKIKVQNFSAETRLFFHRLQIDWRDLDLYSALGCKHCNQGYSGRTAVFEMLPISEEISEMILAQQASINILHVAQKNGMKTLFNAALEKLVQGKTTLAEIQRVIDE